MIETSHFSSLFPGLRTNIQYLFQISKLASNQLIVDFGMVRSLAADLKRSLLLPRYQPD